MKVSSDDELAHCLQLVERQYNVVGGGTAYLNCSPHGQIEEERKNKGLRPYFPLSEHPHYGLKTFQ